MVRRFSMPEMWTRRFIQVGGRRFSLYQCSQCRRQTTSTTGIIFENSKLPLVKWFLALYFMAVDKGGLSGAALARYISVTLKTTWILLHRIRSAMGERKNLYKLDVISLKHKHCYTIFSFSYFFFAML